MPTKKQAVETLREKLDNGERGGSPADRDMLLRFSDELKLLREEYGWNRHEKLLRHCVRMSEHADVDLVDTLVDDDADDEAFADAKDAAKQVVAWIHDEYDIEEGSQETNRDYRVAFRMFAKRVTRGEEMPDTHDWISTKTSRDYQPAPDEADMLDLQADVTPMVEAARNPRDACLIALQFEGGFRGGELYDLRVGDISDGEHTLKVRVDGKRGEHDVHLIWAIPWVQDWLDDHPGDADDYLWTKRDEPDRISYQRFLQCFRACADRADVDKPVTPTNFRKSNAYWLTTRGKSQAFIEDRQGRARGSKVISRYVAKFSGETQAAEYARMHNLDVDEAEEPADVAPVTCPRCHEKTPRDGDFCMHCQQALDLESKQLVDAVVQRLEDAAIDADDPDERADLIQGSRSLREQPTLLDSDELHELVSSLD